MLRVTNLTVLSPRGLRLVEDVSLAFAPGKLHALIGPSGCGKSTVVKGVLGLLPRAPGATVTLGGASIAGPGDVAGRIGFVPQFSIAQPALTVAENLRYARRLFARPDADPEAYARLLDVIGLAPHLEKRVGQLSGGQLRRLGLALELINAPEVLFCDEVTSGLDPASELEILEVLRRLADEGTTVVCIIHNLARLPVFDAVHLLGGGRLRHSGTCAGLLERFGVTDPVLIYGYMEEAIAAGGSAAECVVEESIHALAAGATTAGSSGGAAAAVSATAYRAPRPGAFRQYSALVARRWRLFLHDRSQLALTAALTFGFPLLVVVFALKGLPQFESLSLAHQGSMLDRLREQVAYQQTLLKVGSLVSGLIMFQAILLTLMGANSGAREVAGERLLLEKEKLSGLRPAAYAAAKLTHVGALSVFQGLWMLGFVKLVCRFPGDFGTQALALCLCVFAMGAVSLAISALVSSSEKASLLSTYFVGFQLPLSGVVLALPDWLAAICRPTIAAYWGWAGYLDALKTSDSRFYDAVVATTTAVAQPAWLIATVLGAHVIIAAVLLHRGVRRTSPW